jgi:hypothetical protein
VFSWPWVLQLEVHNTSLNSRDNWAMSKDFKVLGDLKCLDTGLSTWLPHELAIHILWWEVLIDQFLHTFEGPLELL